MKKANPAQNKQSTLTENGLTIKSVETKKAECSTAIHVACHSAVRSIDHLGEMIKLSFPCVTSKAMSIHRTKCSCLIMNVIAPSLLQDLKEDLNNSCYSLILDESTDISTKKYLCAIIRYYSVSKQTIVSNYLGLIEITSATADNLFENLIDFMEKLEIPVNHLIGIGVDGANSVCGCNHSLFTNLKKVCPELVLIRCVCHSLNLCSEAACEMLPSSLDFLIKESHSWFSSSPKRRDAYKKMYSLLKVEGTASPHQLVKLSSTRWLSRLNAVKVILEQWFELKTHFATASQNEHCYKARILKELYADDSKRIYLIFLKAVLQEINIVNLLFQQDSADHLGLFTELKNLALSFLRRILVSQHVKLDANLSSLVIYLPIEKVDFGLEFLQELQASKSISQTDKALMKERVFNFLKCISGEILKRFPTNFSMFEKVRHLSPSIILNQTRPAFAELPLTLVSMRGLDQTRIESQWRLLLMIDWTSYFGGEIPAKDCVEFWSGVLRYQNAGGDYAFQDIAKFALRVQSLPISNAVVERAFSEMNVIKTKPRNTMQLKMLDAIMRIRITLRNENKCCHNFVPTEGMLNRFNKNMYEPIVDSDIIEIL